MENLIGPVIVALVTTLGSIIVSWLAKKGDKENNRILGFQEDIHQLREENRKLRAEYEEDIVNLRARLDELESKNRELMTREVLYEIHTTRLEAQIIEQRGTPIPRPEGLKMR